MASLLVIALLAWAPFALAQLPSSFEWTSSQVLISPKSDGGHDIVAVKDPSVVRYNDQWLVYTSTVSRAGAYSMMYTSFSDWSDASNADQYYLDQSAIGNGYRAAPQLFYFEPQDLWYLVYQTGLSSYSTNKDPTRPQDWTATKNFQDSIPDTIIQNMGNGGWIDMWMICDDAKCHLFSSDGNGNLYRSETSIQDFPNGFNTTVIALHDSVATNLFEASNVYKVSGSNTYLLMVEAIGSDGRRYFRSWTSSSIDGIWTPLADSEDNPFIKSNNVRFDGNAWTVDFSHGEMIRAGYDQTMTINPSNLNYLYQGKDPDASGDYNSLPWRLALLTQNESN